LSRSSFDPSARLLASPDYAGLTCPQNHRLLEHRYRRCGRHCDVCQQDIKEGDTGKCCWVMQYSFRIQILSKPFTRFATMTFAMTVCCLIQPTLPKSNRCSLSRSDSRLSEATYPSTCCPLPAESLLSTKFLNRKSLRYLILHYLHLLRSPRCTLTLLVYLLQRLHQHMKCVFMPRLHHRTVPQAGRQVA
jgi:hypothetical protein